MDNTILMLLNIVLNSNLNIKLILYITYPPIEIPVAARGAFGYFFCTYSITSVRSSMLAAQYVLGV